MNESKENKDIQILDSTLQVIKDAQESYKNIAENIANMLPSMPKFDLPKLFDVEKFDIGMISPDIVRERNSWERHKEVLNVQNAVLGVQSKLLKEQKTNTKLTEWVLILTVAIVLISLVSLFMNVFI